MDNKIKMASPWVIYYQKIKALFGEDPEINIIYDNDAPSIKMYVDNQKKADALTQLLPTEMVFGNVTLKIAIIPANKLGADKIALFQDAFEGNPVLAFMASVDTLGLPIKYIVFKNKVVQYRTDDLSDVYGNCSTLYQEIAKEVFGDQGSIYFCTARGE